MEILLGCWFFLGVVALVACSSSQESFFVGTLKELCKADKAEDILMTLFAIVVGWPCIVAVGPITLIRFWW